ncbi:hypothetical protein [Leadbetterella sp. DM7]|uniref:hypothetical protein n=1 Tax=Leadbetterella sp. DM7 TaxID=3235085 RepID=UPI00349E951E
MSLDDKEIWGNLVRFLEQTTGKKPKDLNGVLFLIGVQELGKGALRFDKEQKQDLMHIAICKVLSLGGFYTLEGKDEEGWPHWKQIREIPPIDLMSQETLLKHYVIRYFREEVGVHL